MSKEFLPYITDDQGRSLDIQGGVIVQSTIPNHLDNAPQGWEETVIQFSRNNEFRGVIKSYTTPLKFYFTAAKILRNFYYKAGLEVVLYFIWLKQNLTFGGGYKHEGWYKGEFDFSTIQDGEDGVEVNIIEGGFYKQLQANKTIVYDIPFTEDDPDACTIFMDGMDIYYQGKFLINNGTDVADPNYNLGNHLIDLSEISNEFSKIGTIGAVSRTKVNNLNSQIRATGKHFLKATTAGDVEIKYKFTITNTYYDPPSLNPAAQWNVVIRRINESNISSFQHVVISRNGMALVGTFNLEATTTITVADKDELYFFCYLTVSGASGDAQTQFDYSGEDSIFEVNFKYKKESTIIEARRAYDLGNILCKKMSGDVSTLNSELLSNDQNLLITSFDAIRGIPNSSIKTKFSDYHQSIDALKCISFGVKDNNGKLEERAFAYNKSAQIAVLGESRGFTTSSANEYIYDSIEGGYPLADISDVNGKYSFNNGVVHKTPVEKVKNTYNIKSVYFGDPFAIELIRINLDGKNTTDDKSDNNIAFLDCVKAHADYTGPVVFLQNNAFQASIRLTGTGFNYQDGSRFKVLTGNNNRTFKIDFSFEAGGFTIIYIKGVVVDETINTTIEFLHYNLRRLPYTITGIPNADTVFNIEITVKRNMRKHFPWIRSACHLMDSKKVTWISADRNSDLMTDDGVGNIVKEKEDLIIGTLGEKIYIPSYLTFEIESPINLLTQVSANPGGVFNVGVYNVANNFDGFIIDIKTDEATLATQQYKLLSSPSNTFEGLINR